MYMVNTFNRSIIPANDAERVQRLHEYHILDTPHATGPFKHVASLASFIFKVPIALISFVDADRVWFKANIGMEEVTEVDRGMSLCSLSILQDEVTLFEDALKEPCLLSNPLVVGEFGLRFYAGAPIKSAEGYNLGTICIVDKESRTFNSADQKILEHMAQVVMTELELWKQLHQETGKG